MSDPTPPLDALFQQAAAHHQAGRLTEAVAAYRRALAIGPDYPEAHYHLGNALDALGRQDEAAIAWQAASTLNPNHAEAHNNLGVALEAEGRLDEAASAYARAAALKPNFAAAHSNLCNVFRYQGKLDEAVGACERALALQPDFAAAFNNLGNARKEQGRLDEALAHYRRAHEIEPARGEFHLNLLTGLLYHPGVDDAARFAEHLRFGQLHAPAPARIGTHSNAPDPRRRLRIGYVSADLYDHPVARNLLPLVEAHDRTRFELFFYANPRRSDDTTARFRARADGWRVIKGLSDAQAAEAIRADGIDILVLLAGHFDGNRPLVAAHAPAPVQISFHDPATSGLAAIDYLIADRILVPRQSKESFVERVVRLPFIYVARPIAAAPPVGPLPARGAGATTFGCLNNPIKITDQVLRLWGAVMSEIPASRLLLKFKRNYASAALRERVRAVLGPRGIAAERVILRAEYQDLADHLDHYRDIDIALDPFPFSGATTTFEALWMGVPVVTLVGDFMASRWSASMLSALGLPELIASTPDEYVAICKRLAADSQALAEVRAGLRDRVAASPLCDVPGGARQIERLYRALWRRWCNRRAAPA